MRLARSRADIEPYSRVSEERISALLLARGRARRLVRSLATLCAREKMEFSGVELQVEISIGGQRGLVSHARAGAAAFLISLFSMRPLPSSIATCSSSSSSLSRSSPLQLRPPDLCLSSLFLPLVFFAFFARALRFSLVRRRCGCALTRYRVHWWWTTDCAQLGLGAERIHLRWMRETPASSARSIINHSTASHSSLIHTRKYRNLVYTSGSLGVARGVFPPPRLTNPSARFDVSW